MAVLFARAVTLKSLTGVPKMRREAIPSMKKISPSIRTSLSAGFVIVIILYELLFL